MTNEIIVNERLREEMKKLVIARLSAMNPNTKILLLDERDPITIKDMINAVNDDTPFGRKIVEVQVAYIKMLTSGEIDL